MFDFLRTLWRTVTTPPAIPSNAREMHETERDIEEGARLVEENVRAERVRRARAWVGKGHYCLGAGSKAGSPTPFSSCAHPKDHNHAHLGNVFSDCSGFLCHVLGIPRQNADGSWNNTDHLESLAKKQGIRWADARPGDAVVYGAGKAIGHCGIVVEVDDAGPVKVVHCNAGKPPAVDETSAELFVRKHAVIWRP